MLSHAVSVAFIATTIGLGIFAIVAGPEVHPDHAGLAECVRLHPERYCRIANGFPVKPLK